MASYDINEQFKSITWGGPTGQERFVAVGHNQLHMLSSFDGITWTTTAIPQVLVWQKTSRSITLYLPMEMDTTMC